MIYRMGNMEHFEIVEITSDIQCSNCLTYWPKGVVYTAQADKCLRPSDKVRKLNSDRHDVLSIPNCVIKKGPSHGRRHGKTERTDNLLLCQTLFYQGEEDGVHINTG